MARSRAGFFFMKRPYPGMKCLRGGASAPGLLRRGDEERILLRVEAAEESASRTLAGDRAGGVSGLFEFPDQRLRVVGEDREASGRSGVIQTVGAGTVENELHAGGDVELRPEVGIHRRGAQLQQIAVKSAAEVDVPDLQIKCERCVFHKNPRKFP